MLTGGQTGVDRAATDVAIALGLSYGGWVPKGGWAEDFPSSPGVLARYPSYVEADETEPAARTARNVADADAVLVLRRAATASPGTDVAVACALEHRRPLAVIDPDDTAAGSRLLEFARGLADGTVLNVAGPREREEPGAYRSTVALLTGCAELFTGAP